MKILLVNTYDRGGAANSCKRLHLGLIQQGMASKLLLRFQQNHGLQSVCFRPVQKQLSRWDKISNKAKRILKELKLYPAVDEVKKEQVAFLNQRDKGLEMFSFPSSEMDITTSEYYQEADIVNLHWVANFLDFKSFFEKNTKPVVWTLHDMNPFTGGEHYLETILGIDERGFPIARQLTAKEIQVANKNLALKIEILSKQSHLTIVAPSVWLANEAQKSELFKNMEVHCIPYGLDTQFFSPKDKNYSRDLLGLPKDKKVMLFVADAISNHRKGFAFLKQAFEQLADPNLVLCAIGNKNAALESLNNIFELGPIHDERLMSVAYSAADVFVIPSLMDNLPNTVLESLLCGTPVIGFPIGGIPDMIQDGVNGYLTDAVSVDSLVKTLNMFLANPNCFNSAEIRANAVRQYDQKVQAQQYMDLFRSVLNKNKV